MRILAVIPARAGSKGLPHKSLRPFAGLPLIAHSVLFARRSRAIDRVLVSTDSPRIAAVGRRFGAEAPFRRPADLARDTTPLWPVLRHALDFAEAQEKARYDLVVLLDPTSPTRAPSDLARALRLLARDRAADGVVAVSEPDFHPIWHSVVDRGGRLRDLFPSAAAVARRQGLKKIYRINGLLYVWRAAFVRGTRGPWRARGRHRLLVVPERRAVSIDTLDQFERAQSLVESGLVRLPWLKAGKRVA